MPRATRRGWREATLPGAALPEPRDGARRPRAGGILGDGAAPDVLRSRGNGDPLARFTTMLQNLVSRSRRRRGPVGAARIGVILGALFAIGAQVAPRALGFSAQDAPQDGAASETAQESVVEPRTPAPEAEAAEPSADGGEGASTASVRSSFAPRYRFVDDRDALLSGWLGTGLVEEIEVATSFGGRRLFAVQFGGAGPVPLAERTTILLVGGLDGVSLAGGEAVISVVEGLLQNPGELPPDVTFIALPWANPDGLARWLVSGCTDGRNDRPQDDDGDGRVDEDAADDLDGDGSVLEMLVDTPDGAWALEPDGRFPRPALEGEAPRYARTREGRDDDGDGAFNEDPAGGVVLDRNFPVDWRGPWTGAASGAWPLSEPASMGLARLALARRTALVLVFQGNHGWLAAPGGREAANGGLGLPFAPDVPTYQAVVDEFVAHTGRQQTGVMTLAEAHRGERPGTAVDWCYAALGALAFEVGVWGPGVDGREALDANFQRSGETVAKDSASRSAAARVRDDADWSRWLDDTRGGLGFVDWQPFDLGEGRRGLVGGWERFTCVNPPPSVLPTAVRGLDGFVRKLSAGLPRLEIEVETERRDERIAVLRARVRNMGDLPTGVGPADGVLATRLRLVLPQGVRLVAGDLEHELGQLPARGRSQSVDWLLVAPVDSRFRVIVESAWSGPVEREVTL